MTGENTNKLLQETINREAAESLLEKMTIEYELANPMLCEMANVYTDKILNISVQVNRNEGRNGSYFKLYNHEEYKKASKVARIQGKRIRKLDSF